MFLSITSKKSIFSIHRILENRIAMKIKYVLPILLGTFIFGCNSSDDTEPIVDNTPTPTTFSLIGIDENTVYQTDYKLTKHPVRPVKNKPEGLADINCIHIFERFRNFCSYCDDRKVHELFLNDCLYNYFLVAQSMLQYR